MKTFLTQLSSAVLLALILGLSIAPASSEAGIFISVNIAPPALPVYEQPPVPAPGYIWTPGYWAYAEDVGYYWVPGTWVLAPQPNYLWTPGYWGWADDVYVWHAGYWGPHVGFYGGVNYGYGYGGSGYEGGRWDHGVFSYNRSVNNVNVTNIHNTYNTIVINNVTVNRVSYNGGSGGVEARPTPQEASYEHENHLEATPMQASHEQAARENPQQRAANNGGRPSIAATPRPGEFTGAGVVHARAEEEARPGSPHPEAHPAQQHPQPQTKRPQPPVPHAAPRPQSKFQPRPQQAPHPQQPHAAPRQAPHEEGHERR